MPFITEGKTNLKYVLIVIVLAVIVGGGILGYYYSWIKDLDFRLAQLEERLPKDETDETADRKIYQSEIGNFSLKYPKSWFADLEYSIITQRIFNGRDAGAISSHKDFLNADTNAFVIIFTVYEKDASETLEDFIIAYKKINSGEFFYPESATEGKRILKVGGKNAIWLQGGLGPAVEHIEIYIPKNENQVILIEGWDTSPQPIQEKYTGLLSQMLSTFKFLEDETDQKQEVEQVHLHNLGNYLAGDAENFSQAFSESYIDWGLGPFDMNKEFIEEMFLKERFKQLKDKTPEEVVDLDNKIVVGYSEILESEIYESYEGRHGFHFQEGDVFIYFPSELIPDGFSGVYRKENGIWKIIIAD